MRLLLRPSQTAHLEAHLLIKQGLAHLKELDTRTASKKNRLDLHHQSAQDTDGTQYNKPTLLLIATLYPFFPTRKYRIARELSRDSASRPPFQEQLLRLIYFGGHVFGSSLVRVVDHEDSPMRILPRRSKQEPQPAIEQGGKGVGREGPQ